MILLNIKINYDPANVRFYEGVNPEEDIEVIMPYMGSIHLKDHKGFKGDYNFPALGEGYINWKKIFEITNKYHFKGPFITEIELQGPKVIIEEKQIDQSQKVSYDFLQDFNWE